MRRFLPAGGGGGGEPSSSSSSGGGHHQHGGGFPGERAAAAGLRYRGGDISLGHEHNDGRHRHRDSRQATDGSVDMLARHSSSPVGFFSNLVVDNGYPRSNKAGGSGGGGEGQRDHPSTAANNNSGKMKPSSEFNFTGSGRAQQQAGHLSRISEDGGAFPAGLMGGDRAAGGRGSGESSSGGAATAARSYSGGFSIVGPWEESRDIITTLGAYDPQFSGAMAGTALEMAGMDRYMQLQQDQVPFKVRAKRGCATHPRSIAERERRTRISEKLRKLQDLVPNMDKQTSTADMLDLAVEHIKGLQSELQALKHEQEKCTCCRKR